MAANGHLVPKSRPCSVPEAALGAVRTVAAMHPSVDDTPDSRAQAYGELFCAGQDLGAAIERARTRHGD